jgi:hypothetical protein
LNNSLQLGIAGGFFHFVLQRVDLACQDLNHVVMVIFLRWGGVSGLRPRATASFSANT